MPDVVSPEKRSQMMAGIRGKNTRPETLIRSVLHRMGFRFRLYDKKLPGNPDIVLAKYRAVIFVNGCFWHGHDCHLFKAPQSRATFWREKIAGNRGRDYANLASLQRGNWRTCIVWECALRGKFRISPEELESKLAIWLRSNCHSISITGTQCEL